ncbi:hypothetical protein BH11PLA1_BH11PLA1_14410 [soil metagenome]
MSRRAQGVIGGGWSARGAYAARAHVITFAVMGMSVLPLAMRAQAEPAQVPVAARVPEPAHNLGIEGRHMLRLTGPGHDALILRPQDDKPAVSVRIASQAADGKGTLYDLRYLGRHAGEIDLRDYLVHIDGTALTETAPIVVRFVGVLPEEHDLHLVELAARPPRIPAAYTVALVVVSVTWLAPMLAVVVRRLTRPKPVPPAQPERPAELWERLKPLLELAARGELSPAQRAELEMLALGSWMRALHVERKTAREAVATLRAHPQARSAVELLDEWLHAPGFAVESLKNRIGVLMPPVGAEGAAAQSTAVPA